MAIKVPVYEERVGQAALPGARLQSGVSAADYGAGIAQGGLRLVEGASAIYEKEKKKQQSASVMDAYARLADLDLRWRDVAQSGKGAAALQTTDQALKGIDRDIEDIEKGIADPGARQAFKSIAVKRREQFQEFSNQYSSQQLDVHAESAANAAVVAATQSAARAASDGNLMQIADHEATGRMAVEEFARHQGIDPTVPMLKYTTGLHTAVVESLLESGDLASAQRYLKAKRDEIDTVTAKNYEKLVHGAVLQNDAEKLASTAFAEGEPTRANDALDLLSLENRELYDAAKKRLDEKFADADRARRQEDSPRIGRLEVNIVDSGVLNRSSKDFLELSDEGKAVVVKFEDAEWRSRQSEASRWRQAQNELDRNAMADFRARKMVGDLGQDQASVDINLSYPDASKRARDMMRRDQNTIGRNREKVAGVGYDAFETMIGEDSASFESKKDREIFKSVLRSKYKAYKEDPKNETSPEPPASLVQQWRADALMYGEETAGTLWHTNTRGYKAAAKGVGFTTQGFEERNAEILKRYGITPGAQTQSAARVRVRRPDGVIGTLPQEQVEAFIKANPGASVVP